MGPRVTRCGGRPCLPGNPNASADDFPNVEAFTRIFPELVRLILPQGVFDIDGDVPAQ